MKVYSAENYLLNDFFVYEELVQGFMVTFSLIEGLSSLHALCYSLTIQIFTLRKLPGTSNLPLNKHRVKLLDAMLNQLNNLSFKIKITTLLTINISATDLPGA